METTGRVTQIGYARALRLKVPVILQELSRIAENVTILRLRTSPDKVSGNKYV